LKFNRVGGVRLPDTGTQAGHFENEENEVYSVSRLQETDIPRSNARDIVDIQANLTLPA